MQISLSPETIKILQLHFNDIQSLAGGSIEPGLTEDRVEQLIESMVNRVGEDCNIFEEYDETI